MKRVKKIWGLILSICLMLSIFNIEAHAATGSVTLTSPSATVGSNVTVTATIRASEALSAATVILSYPQSGLRYVSGSPSADVSGGSGSVKYLGDAMGQNKSTLTFSVTFTVLAQGTHQITGSVDAYTDASMEYISMGISGGKVTGKAPSSGSSGSGSGSGSSGGGSSFGGGNSSGGGSSSGGGTTSQTKKDTNNQLSALQVYPGSLSPSFSAGTTSYNMTVPSDIREVTISATPQSSKATVTVSGGKDLKLGVNTAQVIVIAESGASRAYTITIMCGEEEQIQAGGTTNTIDEDFTDEQIPTGFARTKVTYNGREYEGLTNATNNLTLMSLKNDAGSTYYIYNQSTQEFYTFVQISIAEGKYIIPLPLSNEVEAFSKNETVSLTVQDKSFDAWKLDDEFSVAYVMNQDGKAVLYRYDSVDGVFQRYTDATLEVSDTSQKAWFPSNYYMYAIIGLGVLCVILLISMIYFIASRKQRHEGRKKKALRTMERKRIKEEKAAEKAAAKQRAIEEKEAKKQKILEEQMLEQPGEKRGGAVKWILIGLLIVVVVCGMVVGLGIGGIDEEIRRLILLLQQK